MNSEGFCLTLPGHSNSLRERGKRVKGEEDDIDESMEQLLRVDERL